MSKRTIEMQDRLANPRLAHVKLALIAAIVATAATLEQPSVLAQATVTILGVQANHSSVRVLFAPVAGAKDYRVYDINSPKVVKYAGQVHLTASANCPGTAC